MKEVIDIETALEKVLAKNGRYKIDAYIFLYSALTYTQKKFKKPKHVTGKELLEGIKEMAIENYGPTTKLVFDEWGVKKTDDWGEIVFNLVNAKLLGKTEEDKIEDFKAVYDFEEVFVHKYKYGKKNKRC